MPPCLLSGQAFFTEVILKSLLLLLIAEQIVGSYRFCSYSYHYSKDVRDCVLCTDKCPRGFGLNNNCGYDIYGNKQLPGCSRCPTGYFSRNGKRKNRNKLSTPCRLCRTCFPPLETKRKCSPKRNAKCGVCPKGMYKNEDGRCYKCSYCCEGMLESRMGVVSQCQKSGMGRCSCRAYTVCKDRNANEKCLAYKNSKFN